MEPEVASSLISLAGVGTSNIANILMNSHNNKQNSKQWREYANLQRELQNSQNAWNVAQWNRQNQYNSPANQMNLLRQAGLNPNLIYGQLAGASAGSLESAGVDISSPTPNNAAQVSGFGDLGVQIGNQMMQKELNDANIDYIREQTESQRISNAKNQFELNNLEQTYKNQQDNIQANTDSIRQNIEVAKSTISKNNAEIALLDERERAQYLENFYNNSTMYYRIRMLFQQYELNEKQKTILDKTIDEIESRTALNWSYVRLNKKYENIAQIDYMIKKGEYKWQDVLNQSTLELIVEQAANEVLKGKKLQKEERLYLVSLLTNGIANVFSSATGAFVGSKSANKQNPLPKKNYYRNEKGEYIFMNPPKTYL